MRLSALICLLCLAFLAGPAPSAFATAPADPVIAAVPANGLQFFYQLRNEYKESHGGKLPSGTLYCDLRVDEKGDQLMKTINTMPSKEFVVFVQTRFRELKFLPARDAQNRPMVSTVSFSISFDENPSREPKLEKKVHCAFEPNMTGWQAEKAAYYDAYVAAKKEKLGKGVIPSTSSEAAPTTQPAPKNMDKVRKAIGYPAGLSRSEKESVENSLRFRVLVAPNGDFEALQPLHKELTGVRAALAESVSHRLTELKFTPATKDGRKVYAWVVIPFVIDPAN